MKLFGIAAPKPRKFDYKPVFYDAAKEKQDIKTVDIVPDDRHKNMRQAMQRNHYKLDLKLKRKPAYASLLIMLLMLLVLLYIIFLR